MYKRVRFIIIAVKLSLIATSVRRLATSQKKTVAHLIGINAIISYLAEKKTNKLLITVQIY